MFELSDNAKKEILQSARRHLIKSGMSLDQAKNAIERFKDGIIEAMNEAYDNEIDFISQYKG